MNSQDVRDRPAPGNVRAPAGVTIDPRILARLVSVRHDRRRRRWRLAVALLAVATLGVLAWLVTRSPLLAVRRVDVVGAAHTGRPAVVAASGLSRGRPMVDVDGATIARALLALPWVARVQVVRHWPHTVTIRVAERRPVAQLADAGRQVALVDQDGRVLVTGPNAAAVGVPAAASLPLLLDSPPAGPPGSRLGPGVAPVLAVLPPLTAALSGPVPHAGPAGPAPAPAPAGGTGAGAAPAAPAGPGLWRITAVLRGSDGSLEALLSPGPITVVLGTTTALDAKAAALPSLLAQVPPGTAATIDVRVVDAPVLTGGKIGTMVSTTQRG
ncbi:MAG TPA: FtsQ-type POTRA domain-containing protein [Acidimicrobiales bacterium]|jgi:cell division protein FtsQ|nr:FtsQ-type POTRA domain-containing protein [Acidimicrobiales bacterium]